MDYLSTFIYVSLANAGVYMILLKYGIPRRWDAWTWRPMNFCKMCSLFWIGLGVRLIVLGAASLVSVACDGLAVMVISLIVVNALEGEIK